MNSVIPMKSKGRLNKPSAFAAVVDYSNSVNDTKCCKIDFEKVFDQPCFLEQLRLEKHRAQRSRTQLSILVLAQEPGKKENLASISEMLKIVGARLRETDIIGYLDQSTLGVLLPYTDASGAEKIVEKIMAGNENMRFAITAATYPNQIFESLAKNGCVSSDVLKLMLEDSIDNSRFELGIKRVVDIAGSIAGLLLLSPIMLMSALLVKVNSPGPIIFTQTRLGKNGAPFTFYKFRSMRTDMDDQIHRNYVQALINGDHSTINNGDMEKPLYKIKSDPRVTPVGKFIRKTSIDELPQLFNVLKGDMSLVGPRPPLAYEAEKYQSWHLRRILGMKPGITGLWQVEGRSRTGFDDAVRLDLKYLQTWSLLLDIKLLLKTVKEVLKGSGAV